MSLFLRTARHLAITLVAMPAVLAAQQTGTVRGRVTEIASGQPIISAQVQVAGTTLGAMTGATGEYVIPNVPVGTRTVIARRIGFAEMRRELSIAPGQTAAADFAMTAAAVTLSEVVVTGTASPTTRRALPNQIESIAGEEVGQAPAATAIDQALQGKLVGAVISENSGQPGGGVSIRLRGTNSILGGAEPLYVIDGVIIDNDSEALVSIGANATRGGAALSNRIADLDPADVDRIEVLKGAAAAALYGSRANNGVIQIFTRRGRAGTPQVSASTEYSTGRTPKKYELVEIPIAGLADTAINTTLRVGQAIERYDVQDDVWRTAHSTTNRLSVTGGSGGTTYFLGSSYQREQGIMRKSDYNRLNLRANLTQQLHPRFDVAVRSNFVRSHAEYIPEGEQTQGVMTGIIFTPTSFNPRFDPNTGRYPANPVLTTNALEVLARYEAPEDVTRFVGGAEGTWRLRDDLTVRYVAGVDDYRREARYLQPPRTQGPNFTGSIQNPVQFSRQFNNDLVATHEWEARPQLTLNTGLGFRYTQDNDEVLRAAASDLPPDQTLVGGAVQSASQARTEIRTVGWYVEERFTLANRLYVTAGLNWDASSAFGESERLQMFPRAGVSYVLSEEPFFRERAGSVLSLVRLRAAYGETGGQPPGAYTRFQNFENTSFAGRAGLVSSTTIGNPDLKPERQREWEVGAEVASFQDRAQLELTYYDKRTKDLVLSVPVAPSTGALRQFQNIGVLSNKGVEIALNTINFNRPALTWRSRLTYAANRERVERLATRADTLVSGYLNAVIEGHPVGVFYGGIYAREPNGAIAYHDTTISGRLWRSLPFRARDTVVVQGARTPVLAQRIIGDPNPDFTMSFLNTFELPRNFELSVLFDGRFGNDVANFTRRITEFFGSDKNVEREIRGDTAVGTFARNPTGRINIYEEYIEDGSFIKLREVALTVGLGQALASRLRARAVSIRLAGRNLYTWTDYSGLDPEVNLFSAQTVARGVDFATTPLPRTFTMSLNLTF
ncbi:MAG: SusC/RagA family TonB-linked outer membrane protein [Gemmatimonadaceae bacterium]